MKILSTICVAAAVLLGLPFHASATLIGDTVTVSNEFNGGVFEGPTNVVVGAGTELSNFGDAWDIDIGADTIRLTCTGNSGCDNDPPDFSPAIDSYVFEDLDWVGVLGSLVGVSFDVSSTANFFVANSTLGFGADFVRLDIDLVAAESAGTTNVGDFLLINLATRHISVPEPGTLALFGLGLAGLGFARRRKAA